MSETKQRKRSKDYYMKCAHKKQRRGHILEPGMQGIMITCNNNEKLAVREAYNILNEYADRLFGPEQALVDDIDDTNDDIEQELQKEVEQLKELKTSVRRFQNVESRVKNCIFIKSTVPDVAALVNAILVDAKETGVLKTRFCLRILPVEATCRVSREAILETAGSLFVKYFQTPFGTSQTYSIVFKSRNNSSVSRTDVISDLAQRVEELNPLNKTNHDNADYTILVDVMCTVCCIAVVRDFKKLRKYNIHEVVGTNMASGEQGGHLNVEVNSEKIETDAGLGDSVERHTQIGKIRESKDDVVDESSAGDVKLDDVVDESSAGDVKLDDVVDERSAGDVKLDNVVDESSAGDVKLDDVVDESSAADVKLDDVVDESLETD